MFKNSGVLTTTITIWDLVYTYNTFILLQQWR